MKNKKAEEIIIKWNDNKAEAIIIPIKLVSGIPEDSIRSLLQVRLINADQAILGEFTKKDAVVEFHPLLAFTRGLKYEIYFRGELLNQISIPKDEHTEPAQIIAIYPTVDSIPMNLLKMHIEFSKSMQEGEALKNIFLLKDGKDTAHGVFLDLEQELWNKEGTVLTLWFDPGRIKRDLQPNKESGTPLQEGSQYRIVIKKDWRSKEGNSLDSDYQKSWIVGYRDSISPDLKKWNINVPKSGTTKPLQINLHEPLDYVLLINTIRIIDSKGDIFKGNFSTDDKETVLLFVPINEWNIGDYTIEIESRLEDLAGNNLNRLFDTDLMAQQKKENKKVYTKSISIK